MKKGSLDKNLLVKDDEKYLQGINLVTGDKINYSRHIMTDTQIGALCVSQKLTKVEKFMYIMMNGDKIQKWSMFENTSLYITSAENAEKILTLLETNYSQYEEFMAIMGQGLTNYLKTCTQTPKLINYKCYDSLYRIILRTVISPKFQGSQVLVDWMTALGLLFHLSEKNHAVCNRGGKLLELMEFINGSFSMNTLPQRRKTALQMINALLEQSQEIQSQSHTKILFFNNDLNPSTRLTICHIMEKILRNKKVPQIWKCVMEYYSADKSFMVRQKAFQIISTMYFQSNAEHIFHELDSQTSQSLAIIVKYLPQLLKTYQKDIKNEPMHQVKLFSFFNRLLRKNVEAYLGRVVDCYGQLLYIVPETVLIGELELNNFPLESDQVMCQLIKLQTLVHHLQFKEGLRKKILKGLRYHQYYFKMNAETVELLLSLLELDVQEDIGIFTLLFGKQIETSKWKNVLVFFGKISEIRFTSFSLEKVVSNVIKLYTNCPYFMLQAIHKVILQLFLIDRKGMQIYLKIRQKCLGSKNWMLRRNFIKLYTYFKMHASYELNKSIMPLVYKNIVNEKNVLIKVEFVRQFIKAYSYLDPTLPQEKVSIKEVITRFSEDRDKQLLILATKALEVIRDCDKDTETMNKNLIRNKELSSKQIVIEQVIPEQKKHVKTQKLIGRTSRELKQKPIKRSMVETKTIAYLSKGNQPDRIKQKQKIVDKSSSLVRSNSTQNKKQKMMAPPLNPKKNRFS